MTVKIFVINMVIKCRRVLVLEFYFKHYFIELLEMFLPTFEFKTGHYFNVVFRKQFAFSLRHDCSISSFHPLDICK